MIVALAASLAAAWLGARWLSERAENAALRSQIAVLKRRLARSRLD